MSAIGFKWWIAVLLMYAKKEKKDETKNVLAYDSHTAGKTDLRYG